MIKWWKNEIKIKKGKIMWVLSCSLTSTPSLGMRRLGRMVEMTVD
jgi:hypothetical protein